MEIVFYSVGQMLTVCEKDEGQDKRKIIAIHVLYWVNAFGDIELYRVGRLSTVK